MFWRKKERRKPQLSKEMSDVIRSLGRCAFCLGYHLAGVCPRIAETYEIYAGVDYDRVKERRTVYWPPGSGWEKEVVSEDTLYPEEESVSEETDE